MNIPLFKIYSDENDEKAVLDVIKRGSYWAIGKEIEEFERKIAEFIGIKYALAFNSGTSALHSLLLAYNLKDSEIIVPSFTFIATANCVLLAGAKPLFAEIEPDTLALDYEDVKRKITDNTKAILPIHYGGCPARDIEKLRILAKENNILLIEDNAQSFGASINNKKTGTYGDSAILSFCQNKIISTGEGGAIVTNDENIFEKLKLIRSHGRVEIQGIDYFSNLGDNEYVEAGYNFRMPTMNAALGISQLEKIDYIIEKRKKNAEFLSEKLSKIKGIKCPKTFENSSHVYQLYTILIENKIIRDKLQNYLFENGIMSKVYFQPIHLKTLYKKMGYNEGYLPKTETIADKVLTLPIFVDLNIESINYIVNIISKFYNFVNI